MNLLRLIGSANFPFSWKKVDYKSIAEGAKSLSDKMTGTYVEKIFLVNVLTAHTLEQSQSDIDFFKNFKTASVDQQEVLRNAAKILSKGKANENLKTDLLNYFYGFWGEVTNRNKKLTDEVKKILSKLIILSEMIINGEDGEYTVRNSEIVPKISGIIDKDLSVAECLDEIYKALFDDSKMPKLENELPEKENPPTKSNPKEEETKAEELPAVFKEFFDEIFQITGKKIITKETILELVDTLDFFKDLLDKDDLCQDIVEPAKIIYKNLYDEIQSTKYDDLKSISIDADRRIPDIRNEIKQKSEELKAPSKENDAALREKLDLLLENFIKLTFEREIAIEEQKLIKLFLVDVLKVSEKQMSECLNLPVENVKKLIPEEFLNDTFKANEEKAQMIEAEFNNLSKKLQQFGEIKQQETKKTEELNNQLQQHKETFAKNSNAQKVKLEDEIKKMKETFKTQGKDFLPELANKLQNLMQQTNENVEKLVDDLQVTITQNKLPENLAIGLEPLDLTAKAKFDLNNLFSEFSTLKNHLVYSELTPELKTSFDKLNSFFDKLVDSNKTENVKLQLKDEQGNVIYPKVNIINEPEIKQPENKNQPSGEAGQGTSIFSRIKGFLNWFRENGDETQQKPKIPDSSGETPQPPDSKEPPKTPTGSGGVPPEIPTGGSGETPHPSDSEESSETPDSSEETPHPPNNKEPPKTLTGSGGVPPETPTGGSGVPPKTLTGGNLPPQPPTGGSGVPPETPTGSGGVPPKTLTGGNLPPQPPTGGSGVPPKTLTGGNLPPQPPTGGGKKPIKTPTGGSGEPLKIPTGVNSPPKTPTGGIEKPIETPTGGGKNPIETPTGGSREPLKIPTGIQKPQTIIGGGTYGPSAGKQAFIPPTSKPSYKIPSGIQKPQTITGGGTYGPSAGTQTFNPPTGGGGTTGISTGTQTTNPPDGEKPSSESKEMSKLKKFGIFFGIGGALIGAAGLGYYYYYKRN